MNLADRNYKYCSETIALKNRIEEGFLLIGERLARIRNEELYKGQWESFPDFLEDMRIAESSASKLINIYLKFIVNFKIPATKLMEISAWSDLSDLLPFVSTKKEAIEMIDQLAPLRRMDRRKLLQEKKTGIPMAKCKHDFYSIRICRLCGEREKIYE